MKITHAPKRGRPNSGLDQRLQLTLTREQKAWLKKRGKTSGTALAAVIRDLIRCEMTRPTF